MNSDLSTSDNRAMNEPILVIERNSGFNFSELREIWAYRELLWVLVARDIKLRYKQTVLGSAWAIIQPVTTMVVFSIFFGKLAQIPSDGLPYPLFAFAGILPWLFFSNAVASAGNSLVGSAQLVSKIYFPRLIIPLASIGAAALDFAVASVVLLVMMLAYGIGFGLGLLLLPVLALGVGIAALSIGIALSALNVAYRDFRYVIPFLLQLWMLVTPVAYPTSLVPEMWRPVYYLNPMVGMVDAFRSILLGRPLDLSGLLVSCASVVVLLIIGISYFKSVERKFADII